MGMRIACRHVAGQLDLCFTGAGSRPRNAPHRRRSGTVPPREGYRHALDQHGDRPFLRVRAGRVWRPCRFSRIGRSPPPTLPTK